MMPLGEARARLPVYHDADPAPQETRDDDHDQPTAGDG